MKLPVSDTADDRLNERLATRGFRFTPQRQHVYSVLLVKGDHPTAEEVFIRAKKGMPDISMATVYNCLDALVTCGLVRLVNVNRGAARYCANMQDHWHFCCRVCERVYDVEARADPSKARLTLPVGFSAEHYEVAIHGVCGECSGGRKAKRKD